MNELRLLTPADLEQTTAIMAQAFCPDPAWTYVVPQVQHRQATLAKLFRGVIRGYIRNQQGYGVGDPLQGVAMENKTLCRNGLNFNVPRFDFNL